MAVAQRTAHIHWQGDVQRGGGTVHLETSGAGGDLPISLPTRSGDSNGQTSPEELIAASHAGCYAMALSMTLTQAEHPPESLEASAKVTLDRAGEGFAITRSELTVKGKVEGIDASEFEDYARQAEQACPVSNALRGAVEITLDASFEE